MKVYVLLGIVPDGFLPFGVFSSLDHAKEAADRVIPPWEYSTHCVYVFDVDGDKDGDQVETFCRSHVREPMVLGRERPKFSEWAQESPW